MASYPCIMPGCSFVAKDSADLNQHINTRHFSDQDDVPPLSSRYYAISLLGTIVDLNVNYHLHI